MSSRAPLATASLRAYVGCRTTAERHARGEGIALFEVPPHGEWVLQHVTQAGDNPSYLCLHPDGHTLYCAHGDQDSVSAFAVADIDGRLTPLGRWAIPGRNPVHLALSPDRSWLVVACYASGNVCTLAVRSDGRLGPVVGHLALPGAPGPLQQHRSHPHQVMFDRTGRWLMVPDKGLNKVFTLVLDHMTGELAIAGIEDLPAGSGPRHLVFDAKGSHAYLVCELSSKVCACRFDMSSGEMRTVQTLSTLPNRCTADNSAAGISLSHQGYKLHVSNRGHHSIATFDIDQESGKLTVAGWCGTGGRTPRFITTAPDGRTVLAANEDDDSITTAPLQHVTLEAPLRQPASCMAQTGSPVCIIFTKETL